MIFLTGVIIVALSMFVALVFGSKSWAPYNRADEIAEAMFYCGIGIVCLSAIIALTKVMP